MDARLGRRQQRVLGAGDFEHALDRGARGQVDGALTSIRIGSAAATHRGATTRRDRRAIPRSIASIPTSSGVTRATRRRISASRLAAAVSKPWRTMSVSSSAKYATPTRAPLGASSIRSESASASTPALDAR